MSWTWDPTLYAGAAPFYPVGRVAYPPELATCIAGALGLDGTGRLLDVGCGPGSLTLPLAPYFAAATGVDADPDMLAEAARQAEAAGVVNTVWRNLRAEELPADLAAPDVVTFAQSFHWMDQPRVAATVRAMLAEGGALVHVGATTHEGMEGGDPLPHPRPPRAAIRVLIRNHLGAETRAGQSVRGTPADGEDSVFRDAGLRGPERIALPPRVVERSAAEVRASVYSLSSAAPHLFGERLGAFDARLCALLDDAVYSERLDGITVSVWR